MTQYKRYKLGDLITHKKGFAFKSKDYSLNGISIVRVSDLTEDSVDLSNCLFVNQNLAETYSEYALEKDDMVITTVGSWQYNPASVVGKVIKVPKEASNSLLNQNAVRLRANEKANQHFLFYRMKCDDFKEYIVTGAQGSANQAAITLQQIFGFEFDLPDLHTQTLIASILSSLDDKIELNRRTNHTLEQIAQTLFKKYFVDDIDPGNLPDGWRWGKLGEVFNKSKESINPGRFPDKTFQHYSLPAFDESKRPTIELGSSILSNKFVVKKDSILFSKLNPRFPRIWPIGKIDETKSICSTEFLVFIPNRPSNYSFSYLKLMQEDLISDLVNKATGTSGSHQRIRPDEILELDAIIPDNKAIDEFESEVRPIIKKAIENLDENLTLTKIRDSLLPKLMSGEIEVNTLENELVNQ